MKKVLSVIIPVYNMEKYIRQCLESLMIKEVLDKIEILVVLDGSTDRSEEIAMEYAVSPMGAMDLQSTQVWIMQLGNM